MVYADAIGLMLDTTPPLRVFGRVGLLAMLRFNYHVMVAAGPLLDLAAEVAHGALLDGEPTLAQYYARHAEEERAHAQWLKDDIEELGGTVLDPDHAAACIAGAQYYYLNHVGAVPFLGYLAAFELRPLKPGDLKAARRMTGGRGLRTLAHHAEHDPQHAAELSQMIECYRTDGLIAYNAVMTHKMYMSAAAERISEVAALDAPPPDVKETTLWH
jgi:hypothetical protein